MYLLSSEFPLESAFLLKSGKMDNLCILSAVKGGSSSFVDQTEMEEAI